MIILSTCVKVFVHYGWPLKMHDYDDDGITALDDDDADDIMGCV